MKISVSVCLCTYRRKSLMATLQGIANQLLPENILLDVVVVDSDSAGSAKPQIELAQSQLPISIRSFIADRPGVAEARNKAVNEALGNWLAFIDDDEFPEPDWLAKLLASAETYVSQVVFGAVRTIYPAECPNWIREGDLFGKSLPSTGTLVRHGPTCNTLLAKSALDGEKYIFNVDYGTTGGEDTELFNRLSKKGVKMVACQEAIVTETVEIHRLNREFLLKKALRVGETYFRIFFAEASLVMRIILMIRAFAQWIVLSILALLFIPFGLGCSMKYQIKAAANLGKIRAAIGWQSVELYKG